MPFEMLAAQNPEIRKAVNTLYELSADEKVRLQYEMHQKAVRDRAWLRNDGYNEGVQVGIQEGMQKGMQEGMQKGILEVAGRMKSMGIATEQIIVTTGLPRETIETL